jgi:glycosyltransferase involved in cell wall biosynthesis
LKTHHADIYFSPYYKTVFGGFFRRIVTVHDILFLRRRDVPAWRRMLIRHRLGRCVKKADMVLVDSGHTRSDVHRLLPGSEEKTVILYPDLGAAWQESVPDCLAKEIRTRYQRPYFLYVGNFNPHKNVQLLLEAFAEFRREEPHAEHLLLLVGGAKEVAAPWISGHGLDSHVEVLSHVSDQELRALYGCASWFITASAYEGFGYPVVEAMQSGCPVICAPETSLSEVSGNICVPVRTLDRAGIVRAIHRAVHMTAGEREDMVDQGRKHVQQFAPGTAAQRLMACLASAHFPMP